MAANGEQERNELPQPQPQPQGGSTGSGFTISGKMLGIAGGGAAALVVVIVVVVLLVAGVFGGGGGGGASGGSDVLAYIPGNAVAVAIWDNQAALSGDIPEDYIEWLEEEDEDSDDLGISSETYKALEIDDDDVALGATVIGDEKLDFTLEIVQGDFRFDVIREELEDGLDCEDDDYRGFELWECPGQQPPAVALFEKDGYVVMAVERQDDLEDMLTLKSRAPEKLADAEDSELKSILDQVGDGWLRFAALSEKCVIQRCEGLAFAIRESDDSELIPASYAVKFSSERAATAAEGDVGIDEFVKELFAGYALDLDIGDVKADGEFVVGDGTAEFVDPDDASSRSSNQNNESGGRRGSGAARAPTATESPRAVAATPRLVPAQPAATIPQAQAATARPTNTPAPTPTATPVPLREPESTFDLVPQNSHRILLVRWGQTESGSFLPSRQERQIFDAIDFIKNHYDINPDNVSEIAFVNDAQLTVLHGDFDLASVRSKLQGQDGEAINYRGYEMWRWQRGQVILFDQYIAYSGGGLEGILQGLYRGAGSLASASDNNDMRKIMSRLSDGIVVWADRSCGFENCLGYGWKIASIDNSQATGSVNIEFLFRNERSSQNAADDYDGIANFMRSSHAMNIHDTVPDGNYVVGAAVWDFNQ